MVIPDAPARALVIFGDGLMQSLSPSHSHLHALARSGACGFLALRELPHHINNSSRHLYEMQQLLDVHDRLMLDAGSNFLGGHADEEISLPSIAERFMGMKAALITTSEPVANLGKRLGFTISNDEVKLSFTESPMCKGIPQPPTVTDTASRLLELLGLSALPAQGAGSFELVLVHIGGGPSTGADGSDRAYLDWIDGLVGEIKALAEPGTKAYDHLYLSLVLGYGNEAANQASECPSLGPSDSLPPSLKALRPRQSYDLKDSKRVDGVRDHHPLLVVHQMDGVTRRDFSTSFGFQEFRKNGCNSTILADRFLHEIAFKLWKAPKYGA